MNHPVHGEPRQFFLNKKIMEIGGRWRKMIKAALNSELRKIVDISRNFGAEKVLLFGSCLEDVSNARDIDIAVSGVPARKFFEY